MIKYRLRSPNKNIIIGNLPDIELHMRIAGETKGTYKLEVQCDDWEIVIEDDYKAVFEHVAYQNKLSGLGWPCL